ncbi:pyridoxamine 5'-phosphate oxidase-domain-containing protein [Cristinia sonorae]|uniref:Pyridoxamine 5'-phosphate oxidase-domain-containing protein n=1 Tax=Cristinia sonorae TaxID=1940300 RepID=A0A8K0UJ68_9AGAR|nr:pyridoxamine 5'-phosphate oxidase-domain-containing protein [Cristinia sonorae]
MSQPRWFQFLNKATSLPENKNKTVYQIATIDSHNKPHVRSHIHRAFLIPNSFPAVPILLTTTDIRTPKVTQMLSNTTVEVAWWLEGSQDQFRFSGRAAVISHPEHPFHVMRNIPQGSALAKLSESGEIGGEHGKLDWEKKRREVFDTMSAHMRASWCRPPPGTVLSSYDDAKTWAATVPKIGEAETEEDKANQAEALQNFALVLIEPLQVDWVQLGVIPNRRTVFRRKEAEGNGDEWVETIEVP